MQEFVQEVDIKNDFQKFWNFLDKYINQNEEISSIYNKSFYAYQKEYCISKESYIDEISKIFIKGNVILCGYVFLLNKDKKITELNFGMDFPGLIFINEDIDKKNLSKFLIEIEKLKKIDTQIRFTIPRVKTISKSYEEIMNKMNFSHKNIMTRKIDLCKSKDELWKDIRKSYKSPINKGLREQKFTLLDYKNPREDIFKEIQNLHYAVAGKVTRSQLTWDLQFSSIKKDNSFAICSYEEKNLTSAVYFLKSSKHAYYSVGIFTNESKNKLYGYSLIWKSILYCKKRCISFFEIDHNINFKSTEQNDNKLIQISYFKSGFGGKIYPKHEFII
tara:strand:- start:655 stop:1650 length:996 start_codon:yes stop_codon:yes gene_type:complete